MNSESSAAKTDMSHKLYSSQLQELCAASNLSDFQDIVDFIKVHLDDVISEVHGFDKLLVDDGKVSLNCPPAPESGDSHGGLLIRTVSEQSPDLGEHLVLSREVKVHDLGKSEVNPELHRIEIRCDVTRMMPDDSRKLEEQKIVIEISRKK